MPQQGSGVMKQASQIKAPEGLYHLHNQRTVGLTRFNSARPTKLSLAVLAGGKEEGIYLIYNSGMSINISPYDSVDKAPQRTLQFNQQGFSFPTCHAFNPSSEESLLLVGFHSQQVVLLNVREQLKPSGSRPKFVATYSPDDDRKDPPRCMAVAWVPQPDGQSPQQQPFVAAYADGSLLCFHRWSGRVLAPTIRLELPGGCVNDVAFSPDGARFATATRDGVLRVFNYATQTLLTGFQGYYGSLLCCAWSPNGQYIATGGEDDLVTVFSMKDNNVLVFGEGHTSWVSHVAFDPWASVMPTQQGAESNDGDQQATYRLVSVSHDACLCFWDVTIPEPTAQALDSPSLQLMGSNNSISGSNNLAPSPTGAVSGKERKKSRGGSLKSLVGLSPKGRNSKNLEQVPPMHSPQVTSGDALTAPSTPREDMPFMRPISRHLLHSEPMSSILCTAEAMFTGCHAAQVRCWVRPGTDEEEDGNARVAPQ